MTVKLVFGRPWLIIICVQEQRCGSFGVAVVRGGGGGGGWNNQANFKQVSLLKRLQESRHDYYTNDQLY